MPKRVHPGMIESVRDSCVCCRSTFAVRALLVTRQTFEIVDVVHHSQFAEDGTERY
jgi:hypothetical protein